MIEESHDLARAVSRLSRRLRQERRSDLTATQLSALVAIHQLGQASPGQVAALERVTAPSMTRTLNCLADDGLIRRDPHPDDGRQVVVSISEAGSAALAAERDRRDAWLDDHLQDLTADERKTLAAATPLLERLAEGE